MRAFAADPSAATFRDLPLAPAVQLGVGTHLLPAVPAAELADPRAWDVPAPSGYEFAVGPLSALTLLRSPGPHTTSVGPHPHCAGPPRPAPAALADLERISTQPARPDSCLAWYTVDAYVRDGKIRAVALDLWEP